MLTSLVQFDQQLLLLINSLGGKSPFLDNAMKFISAPEPWIVGGVCILGMAIKSRRVVTLATFILALISLGLTDLISFEVIKPFVGRERPCWTVDGINKVLGYCGGSYGFPSNHAANAGAFISILFWSRNFTPKILALCTFLGLLIGFSRIYLGVHYPGDVIGGFIIGASLAALLTTLGMNRLATSLARKVIMTAQKLSRPFERR